MQSIFLSLLLLLVLLSTNARSTSQPSTAPRVSKAQLLNLFSGGFAGTVSSTITSPLEVVKTQLQASSGATSSPLAIAKSIYKQDGIPGFWRGLPPTLVGIIPARSIYFASYEGTKTYLTPKVGTGTVNALMSGLAAGIAANTATNPIWMVKTRMQLLRSAGNSYTGYGNAISTIYKQEGLGGFYRGVTASYWGASEGMIQFVVYEKLKNRMLIHHNKERAALKEKPTTVLPKQYYLIAAGLSKGIASVSTYPHEVARTRMREFARDGVFKYNGMFQTLGVIGREEGMRGLYAGMGTHVARVVPNSALMFCVYETVKEWIKVNEVEQKKK